MTARADLDALRARLAARVPTRFRIEGFRESAVLVPLLLDENGPTGPTSGDAPPTRSAPSGDDPRLVFTERPAALRRHAGQVAFPGGRRDPGDADLAATAVREAAEEIGIPPAAVDVLGQLDDCPTPSGYVITPFVAAVRGPLTLRPAPDEVAAIFLASPAALRAPGHYRDAGHRTFLGVEYTMHEYHWQRWRIWGATAHILHQLLHLLD